MKDIQYIGGWRHPKNRYGQGSKEFYEEEFRLYDCTREEYFSAQMAARPKCKVCGTPQGYAWGTGDCGCEVGYE